jgi:hypothetical protein
MVRSAGRSVLVGDAISGSGASAKAFAAISGNPSILKT